MPQEDYEDTPELARRTKTSESYWNKLRVAGAGPPYVKVGRLVRYQPSAVDAWLANLTRNSTSEGAEFQDDGTDAPAPREPKRQRKPAQRDPAMEAMGEEQIRRAAAAGLYKPKSEAA